jgi:hypothetical protein
MEKGATPKEITKSLQMTDVSMISKFLRVRELSSEVRHLVSWGYSGESAIGFSVAAQLSRLPENEHVAAADAVLRYRLTRNEMMSVIQLRERSKESLQACIDRVVGRRPTVAVRQIVLGAVLNTKVRDALHSLSQLRRDEILESCIMSTYPAAKKFTAKLGVDRFTIVGGKSVASTIAADEKLEATINKCLQERLA